MTRYDLFRQLEELLELQQTGEHCYNKMIITGDLEFGDYGTGFLDVSMWYMYMQDQHIVRVWFGTIDDGDFGSWNVLKTKEKALEMLDKVVEKFKEITVCPCQKELNDLFSDIGVRFDYCN